MINYYKYLPVSAEDKNWGLHVLNAGCNHIHKSDIYPSPKHPEHYYFNWDDGRILDEYQVIYITNGEGLFESESCKQSIVKEGTVILLFPNEWHRFKPDVNSGWDEYWVGFKGEIVHNLFQKGFIQAKNPLLHIGIREHILQLFLQIIESTKEEKPGYQPLISGAVLHLLGCLYAMDKETGFSTEDPVIVIVNKARVLFRSNIDVNITPEKVARELQVSYAWFRKAFKKYTGIAPGQYLLQLKIEKAKLLLSDSTKSVKEIAFKLNFDSEFYFSKLFKAKTGNSPEQFRKKFYTN